MILLVTQSHQRYTKRREQNPRAGRNVRGIHLQIERRDKDGEEVGAVAQHQMLPQTKTTSTCREKRQEMRERIKQRQSSLITDKQLSSNRVEKKPKRDCQRC